MNLKEENPWKEINLNNGERILDKDSKFIDEENSRSQKPHTSRRYKLRTELFPMPFIGDVEQAEIYLLQANPGVDLAALAEKSVSERHESDEDFEKSLETCLRQDFSDCEYPFYFLDPVLWQVGGSIWWRNKLSELIYHVADQMWKDDESYNQKNRDKGNTKEILLDYLSNRSDREEKIKEVYEKMARKICAVEIHGYRSKNYRRPKGFFPSSKFQARIVEHAIRNNKAILLMRSKDDWKDLMQVTSEVDKNLPEANHLYELESSQNVNISAKNLTDGSSAFKNLVNRIVS